MQKYGRYARVAGLAAALALVAGGSVAAGRQTDLGRWPDWPAASTEAARREEALERRRLRAELAAVHRAGHGTDVLVRSGTWSGPGGRTGRWRARLEHDRGDGSLRGQVSSDGGGSPAAGTVDGTIRGRSVRGTVTGPDGRRLARFTGTLKGDAMSGTYQAQNGERGRWTSP